MHVDPGADGEWWRRLASSLSFEEGAADNRSSDVLRAGPAEQLLVRRFKAGARRFVA